MQMSGGTQQRIIRTGAVLLLALAVVPALAGTAGAATAAPAGSSASSSAWAYGGQAWSNGSITIGNESLSWHVSYGETVIFNATNTSSTTTQLKLERTVMLTVALTATTPNESGTYSLKALESDTGYANVTTQGTVYVGGIATPALALINASLVAQASIAESLSATIGNQSASAAFNANASALGKVSFAPALGLVPLNLTGVTNWNSSAMAIPSVTWNGAYAWSYHALNGTSGSGNNAFSGNWTTNVTVALHGSVIATGLPVFHDHHARVGAALAVSGPLDLYDGVLVIPHAFDFFGGASPTNSTTGSMGSATMTEESLYLNQGDVHMTSFTAAGASLNANPSGGSITLASLAGNQPAVVPAASSPMGASLVMQPESPSQAQSQAKCLDQYGCYGGPGGLGPLTIALVALGIAAVAGAVAVVAMRSRRRPIPAPYPAGGAMGPGGVPPAVVSAPPTPPTGPTSDAGAANGPAPPQA
jgi:hypothetical protein